MKEDKKKEGKEEVPEFRKQSFKVKKRFPTEDKVYEVGDTFRHHDKRVINFLKSKNII